MSSAAEALIEELSAIHPKGFDLSLDRISKLLAKLANPQRAIPPAIHVAGTNGKGSTLAFCRAFLEAGGFRTHLHTSPHLVSWNERYRLAGTLVDDETLADAIRRTADANAGNPITIFEIMSAVMFLLFSEHSADYSLVEVGLGGRFDATNVIQKPLVAAIGPIAMDHQAYLGDTIAKIAFEKAGIVKPGAPVVVGEQFDDAAEVLETVAHDRGARIRMARRDFDWYRDATGFVYQDEDGLLDLPLPRLSGEHQLANAALAIAAIRAAGIPLPEDAFSNGMNLVSWPGRLERLPVGKLADMLGESADVWIDGGHNPAAGEVVAQALSRQRVQGKRPLLMVCGMINTKEPLGYFKPFVALDAEVIAVPVSMSDAGLSPDELSEVAKTAGLKAEPAESLEHGIAEAASRRRKNPGLQILFCGSLYLVGEVLEKNGTPPE